MCQHTRPAPHPSLGPLGLCPLTPAQLRGSSLTAALCSRWWMETRTAWGDKGPFRPHTQLPCLGFPQCAMSMHPKGLPGSLGGGGARSGSWVTGPAAQYSGVDFLAVRTEAWGLDLQSACEDKAGQSLLPTCISLQTHLQDQRGRVLPDTMCARYRSPPHQQPTQASPTGSPTQPGQSDPLAALRVPA